MQDYPEYILDANIFTNGEERKTKDKPQNKFKGIIKQLNPHLRLYCITKFHAFIRLNKILNLIKFDQLYNSFLVT